MVRILQIFKHQWLLKLLSLALAVSLWAYVRKNPQWHKEISRPITCINIPQGLAVLRIQPEHINVILESKQAIGEDMLAAIRVVADLSGAQVGEQRVTVEPHGLPHVVDATLNTFLVSVTLDKLVSDQRPVRVESRGLPAEGYGARSPDVRPNQVTITGASSLVRSVDKVVAVVDISGYSATAEVEVEIEARDERNVAISGLRIEPARVQVTVPITQLAVRSVLVKPDLSDPAPGYQISSVQASPNTVAITGNANKVNAVEYLGTKRIDISQLRGKQTFTVDIDLPAGIRSMGVGAVTVTVTVEELPGPPPEAAAEESVQPEPGVAEEKPAETQPEPSEPVPPEEAPTSAPSAQ